MYIRQQNKYTRDRHIQSGDVRYLFFLYTLSGVSAFTLYTRIKAHTLNFRITNTFARVHGSHHNVRQIDIAFRDCSKRFALCFLLTGITTVLHRHCSISLDLREAILCRSYPCSCRTRFRGMYRT